VATVDHRKLDAYHRARLEIAALKEQIGRRIYDEAKTEIDSRIQRKLAAGEDFDGGTLGREATLQVAADWILPGEPTKAIPGETTGDED